MTHFGYFLFFLAAIGVLANSYGIVVLSRKMRGNKPKTFNYKRLVKVFLPDSYHYAGQSGHGVYADKRRHLLVYRHNSKAEAWEAAWYQALQEGLIKVPGMRAK